MVPKSGCELFKSLQEVLPPIGQGVDAPRGREAMIVAHEAGHSGESAKSTKGSTFILTFTGIDAFNNLLHSSIIL